MKARQRNRRGLYSPMFLLTINDLFIFFCDLFKKYAFFIFIEFHYKCVIVTL